MRIKNRFTLLMEEDTMYIINYLNKKNIRYVLSKGIPLITFEVFEDNEAWYEINNLMERHGILFLKECLYSEEEYNNASWFVVRSKWRWGYPQPENNSEYKHLTYDDSNYCDKCGCGLSQKENFSINNPPKWVKRIS